MIVHRFFDTDKPAPTPYAKCLLCCYGYFCLNFLVGFISFAAEPEGHYRQLVITLRAFTLWGAVDGCIFLLAVLCGPAAYKMFFSKILSIISSLYGSVNELMVIFLIISFVSYLNFPFLLAALYGIMNAALDYFANRMLAQIYAQGSMNQYARVPDFRP